MNGNTRWIQFDRRRQGDAARLLRAARNGAFALSGEGDTFSEAAALESIETELAKEVSSALMLVDGDALVGYAIATTLNDPVWGVSGWLAPGALVLGSGYDSALPELYALVGRDWLDRGIVEHKVFTFSPGGVLSEMWNELGFAKQQAYAMLDGNGTRFHGASASASVRPAVESDREEIATFSRVIASYQATGPCFAPVPDRYLLELDDGFAGLLDDDEAEVMVAEGDGGTLRGLAVLFAAHRAGLMAPAGSVELSVVAVRAEARGAGVGTALFRAVVNAQRDRGTTCMMTDWRCANPISSRFWPRMGFSPIGYRLLRRLDPLCLEVP